MDEKDEKSKWLLRPKEVCVNLGLGKVKDGTNLKCPECKSNIYSPDGIVWVSLEREYGKLYWSTVELRICECGIRYTV